jgi:hypothetical protein
MAAVDDVAEVTKQLKDEVVSSCCSCRRSFTSHQTGTSKKVEKTTTVDAQWRHFAQKTPLNK